MMLPARNLLRTTSFAFALIGTSFAQTFSAPKHYPPFTDSYRLVVGDFNRDGAADLIGVANVSGSTQIYLYLNNGVRCVRNTEADFRNVRRSTGASRRFQSGRQSRLR